MSRGYGIRQRMVVDVIRHHGKPLTFAELCVQILRSVGQEPDIKFLASFRRSTRRALHRLTKDEYLIAVGDGGRGDPLRYFFHPMIIEIAIMGKTPEAQALKEALWADPGTDEAVAKGEARVRRAMSQMPR